MLHAKKSSRQLVFMCLAILLLLTTSPNHFGQSYTNTNPSGIKPSKVLRQAKSAERLGDLYTAIDLYRYYCKHEEEDLEVRYKLATLYLLAKDYRAAGEAFQYVYQHAPDAYKLALYYWGITQMHQQQYRDAHANFHQFRRVYRGEDNDRYYRRLAYDKMASCDIAYDILDSAINVTTTLLNTSINKPFTELSPLLLDDNLLLFASLRLDSLIYYPVTDTLPTLPSIQYYTASRKSGDQWEYTGKWQPLENITEYDIGNGALNKEKNRFYYTQCKPNWQNKIICQLYWMQKDSLGLWGKPAPLPEPVNHPDYTTTHPAIGKNSIRNTEVIYFSSDRPEGRGGMDIWYVEYDPEKDYFRDPRNMGLAINTMADEVTPYYHNRTKTLYFSSDGHPGIGGLDIFRTSGEMRRWSSLENVGYPINSPYDDLYFTNSLTRKFGFFVSNRPSSNNIIHPTCCDDLYHYIWNNYIEVTAGGKVFDVAGNYITDLLNRKFNLGQEIRENNTFVGGVPVTLYMEDKNNKQDILLAQDTTHDDGSYQFSNLEYGRDYFVIIETYGFFDKKISFTTRDARQHERIDLSSTGINFIPDIPITLDIYYDFNSSKLTKETKHRLDTSILDVMNALPNIIVELSSHTDSQGDPAYNLQLSQKRADGVVRYLISQGISKDRLIARGYGNTRPIKSNETEEGRALNRRTEIRIVGSLRDLYYHDE